ncbi:diguanylate cyclase [Bifidobacterium aerophilum]|uniref:Diguanylate cyclase n=1 Tax=Bifidobacterium aerophilum TaxID=1798155 RepID=A0A6N9Z6V6_9BIFI|nr:diguanylate cyclase [Bifidobacterium aerophilum]
MSAQPTEGVPEHSDAGTADFLGHRVNLPFGIPAGPLLNSRFTTAAFRMGFDLATYKTVRSRAWGCNPFPNVLAVHPKAADGSLTPGSAELDEGVLADTRYEQPISISNSFGVPSRDPDEWQPDMKRAIEAAGPGQLLIPSFQGSRTEGMTTEDYIADHVATARLVTETGADLMVMNTSCPNEGHNRLLCHDPALVGRITEAVKNEIGDRALAIKLAYIPPTEVTGGWGPERRIVDDSALEFMVRETAARGSVQAFSAINTISARLVDAAGQQALPGAGRDRSGVCGRAIRHAGLDMVARLAVIREKLGLDYTIIGLGGVVSPEDYAAYRAAGADAVMSATGAMWDADLARKIKAAR